MSQTLPLFLKNFQFEDNSAPFWPIVFRSGKINAICFNDAAIEHAEAIKD